MANRAISLSKTDPAALIIFPVSPVDKFGRHVEILLIKMKWLFWPICCSRASIAHPSSPRIHLFAKNWPKSFAFSLHDCHKAFVMCTNFSHIFFLSVYMQHTTDSSINYGWWARDKNYYVCDTHLTCRMFVAGWIIAKTENSLTWGAEGKMKNLWKNSKIA